MRWRQCKVSETADEVRVEVRFLHPGLTLVMLSGLTILWFVLLLTKGPRWPLIAMMILTSCLALFIGFARSCVSLSPGKMATWTAPLGFDRAVRNPLEVVSVLTRRLKLTGALP
jgi:hypothetical protein